jgi:hypothetical protein
VTGATSNPEGIHGIRIEKTTRVSREEKGQRTKERERERERERGQDKVGKRSLIGRYHVICVILLENILIGPRREC